jgi:hypothetical protein
MEVRTPCKISKPYYNLFNPRREGENALNSGHLVP